MKKTLSIIAITAVLTAATTVTAGVASADPSVETVDHAYSIGLEDGAYDLCQEVGGEWHDPGADQEVGGWCDIELESPQGS